MLRIFLCGRVAVEADGVGLDTGGLGRLGRIALAYLVSERHRPVTRDELAEVLWGDDLPRSWETSLRGVALRLRGLLGAAGLVPGDALISARSRKATPRSDVSQDRGRSSPHSTSASSSRVTGR